MHSPRPVAASPPSSHTPAPVWTRPLLTRLLHGLLLSDANIRDAAALVPHTPTQVAATLRRVSLALRNPASWTDARHARAVLHAAAAHSPRPRRRSKKAPGLPRRRVCVQIVPATPADDAAVRAAAAHPFVEVLLRGPRRVWDVVKHLYDKWALPVHLLLDRRVLHVDTKVAELVSAGRLVRVAFRVLKCDVDWRVMRHALDHSPHPLAAPAVAGRSRRMYAPPTALHDRLQGVAKPAPAKRKHAAIYDLDEHDDHFWRGIPREPRPLSPSVPQPSAMSEPVSAEDISIGSLFKPALTNAQQHEQQQPPFAPSDARISQPSTESASAGEVAVMSRLRSHLEHLDSQASSRSTTAERPPAETVSTALPTVQPAEAFDSAAIPESFLKTSSRFDIPVDAELPDSMLSLGVSDGSIGGSQIQQFQQDNAISAEHAHKTLQTTAGSSGLSRKQVFPSSRRDILDMDLDEDLLTEESPLRPSPAGDKALQALKAALALREGNSTGNAAVNVSDSSSPKLQTSEQEHAVPIVNDALDLRCDEDLGDLGLAQQHLDNAANDVLFAGMGGRHIEDDFVTEMQLAGTAGSLSLSGIFRGM